MRKLPVAIAIRRVARGRLSSIRARSCPSSGNANSQPIAGQWGNTMVHSPSTEKNAIGLTARGEQPSSLVSRTAAQGAHERIEQCHGNPGQRIRQLSTEIDRCSRKTEARGPRAGTLEGKRSPTTGCVADKHWREQQDDE
jgi:hypothetical protein